MKLTVNAHNDQWLKATNQAERVMAKALTTTMRQMGKLAVQKGRERITAAGFSQKFARTLQAINKPPSGYVLNPAVFVHSTINYADVFERGATIHGDPFLWLPFPNVPPFKGRPHMTARQYVQHVGPLVPMRLPNRLLVLGAPVQESKLRARRSITRKRLLAGAAARTSETRLIPMFFAVRQITIPKKFDVTSAVKKVQEEFQQAYDANERPEQDVS